MGRSFPVYFNINGSKVFPVLTNEFLVFLYFETDKDISFGVLKIFLFHQHVSQILNFFIRILTFFVNSITKPIPMCKVTLNYENCIQIKFQLLVTAFIVGQMYFS